MILFLSKVILPQLIISLIKLIQNCVGGLKIPFIAIFVNHKHHLTAIVIPCMCAILQKVLEAIITM